MAGGHRPGFPYRLEESRLKYAQAVISKTVDGQWKIFVQSDRHVEVSLVGTIDAIIAKFVEFSRSDWEQRSL